MRVAIAFGSIPALMRGTRPPSARSVRRRRHHRMALVERQGRGSRWACVEAITRVVARSSFHTK